ncbi:MAG: hypothetical protein P4L76_02270 [Beijerinckiaceae bacterium]|nr:hypothetical protein [Beijerinckiaceae bacterium]
MRQTKAAAAVTAVVAGDMAAAAVTVVAAAVTVVVAGDTAVVAGDMAVADMVAAVTAAAGTQLLEPAGAQRPARTRMRVLGPMPCGGR